ncbi:HTH-type transcriptional regulator DmlR [Paraburkholderia domus]|jgi:DNA-binding transcriptional LysR family regulator|uniref:HTH-type transcriptional regulator DmlR n=1 Tax=Paraburkholderia domus TaxID=2793075 RepID=A0A9N8R1Y7_9BURK|nr:LysR family transcriptional regulator [Paraburkholderia domus]MBK5049927.1 LysR family transcriptional regulator [Burkholderia sp. R-70006]MBK5062963.1 LysR family transcriptional regulator [Burkholderia sp. R-70199]MBK5086663.1 LysR family transcriptional regulator [Burkholderia sp. R-69927]MBK5121385.1 LysR family transcriptional regulator [Burkholderia sp. R-69980]MBK5166528.1 LysR family transcriptional regulator [Burkholderia sp. R-70211]MBK5182403.1 LysR family transcriptional regula
MKTSTDELLVFVTVIDSGSITAAAEKLGQTVSGVSRALTRLEKKLDTELVRRTTRRMQLTEEGEAFLQRARAILDAMEEAEESVTRGRERPSGRLRVDAASPFMLHCVAPHMKAFSALYPEIRLELTSNERIVDLLEQKVDIAIRIGTLQDSTLHARALGSSKLRVLAGPAYLAEYGEPKSVEALRAHRLIGFTAPEHLNRWPLRAGGKGKSETLKIEPAITASSGETLRQLALSGWGIACLADFMTAADVREERLVPILGNVLLDERQPVSAVYYQSASLAGRVQCFLDFIAARVRL